MSYVRRSRDFFSGTTRGQCLTELAKNQNEERNCGMLEKMSQAQGAVVNPVLPLAMQLIIE